MERVSGEVVGPDPLIVLQYREHHWRIERRSRHARNLPRPHYPAWRVTWLPREGRFLVEPTLARFRGDQLGRIIEDLQRIQALLPGLRPV